MFKTICICGAGTMGRGIALVMAENKYNTILFDLDPEVISNAKLDIKKILEKQHEKNQITFENIEKILGNIFFTSDINNAVGDIIIEAIIEKIESKINLFSRITSLNDPNAIFASNTSSLSISTIQNEINNPERFVGVHFFNPANLMKLVEVVKGQLTSEETINTVFDFCKSINKLPVLCKNSPGFIVNRVARHFYLESMKLLEQEYASMEDIDSIMESTLFKLGPFKLMDMIGNDINLSVTEQLYHAFQKAKRFTPSNLQIQLVKNGKLGRKTGNGFYKYKI